jgi:glycosyltransferase involved in cell wall biosynthesis
MNDLKMSNTDNAFSEVLMIRHIWPHHTALGGSGVICDYIDAPVLCANDWPGGNAPHGSWRWNLGRRFFDSLILLQARRYGLVHFIHAENHPRLAFRLAKKIAPSTKLLGTIHLPLDYYSLENSLAAFSQLDGMISLARWQVDQVRELLPGMPVWWVPCGFRMDHPFRNQPTMDFEAAFNVCVAGSNYRDWQMLSSVLDRAQEDYPSWCFHVLGMPAGKRQDFEKRPNVALYPRLDDPDYFRLLGSCDTVFLPLTFATNNTVVLESYSVGTPTLCSDLPAIHDYAVRSTGTFKTAEQAVEMLALRSQWTDSELAEKRVNTYEEGQRFHWREVAKMVSSVYRKMLTSD